MPAETQTANFFMVFIITLYVGCLKLRLFVYLFVCLFVCRYDYLVSSSQVVYHSLWTSVLWTVRPPFLVRSKIPMIILVHHNFPLWLKTVIKQQQFNNNNNYRSDQYFYNISLFSFRSEESNINSLILKAFSRNLPISSYTFNTYHEPKWNI
jgi:hypothetical protein